MSGFRIPEDWGRGPQKSNHKQENFHRTKKQRYDIEERDRNKKHGLGLSNRDKGTIVRRQNNKSLITGEPIYDFHHEPSIGDLMAAGIKIRGGGAEIAVGVSNTVHALLHYAELLVTEDERHMDEVTGIMCRYGSDEAAERAADYFDQLISGPELKMAVEFVTQRRKQYHLPC